MKALQLGVPRKPEPSELFQRDAAAGLATKSLKIDEESKFVI